MWWQTRRNQISSFGERTSPFKLVGASVQSTTGIRHVHISGSVAGYTMIRGSVKGTGYPLHSPVFPSLPLPCVAVCHHISSGVYLLIWTCYSAPRDSEQRGIIGGSQQGLPELSIWERKLPPFRIIVLISLFSLLCVWNISWRTKSRR